MALNTNFKAMPLAHCNALRNFNFIHLVEKNVKDKQTNKTQKSLPTEIS